ncbi:MAG: calcium-binding protein, partial [Pseudomonadota bacterium]
LAAFDLSGAGVHANLTLGYAEVGFNTDNPEPRDYLFNMENLFGTDFGDILVGDEGKNEIWGADGDDNISGAEGDDYLSGGGGDDGLVGGPGDDVVRGGLGDDTFYSGQGDDTISGESGLDTVSYAGVQERVMILLDDGYAYDTGGWGTGDQFFDTLSSIENAIGTSYGDDVYGTNGSNVLEGRGGKDELFGLGGSDTIDGGNGDDTIYGQGSNDTIDGGSGEDRISGGARNDLLTGGSDADTFVFGNGSDQDHITDFSLEDKIDLRYHDTADKWSDVEDVLDYSTFSGNDMVIHLDGDTITLRDFAPLADDLTDANFIL